MKKDYIPLQNSDGELEVYFLKAKSEEPNKCVNHESPASAEEKFKEVGEALGWEAMPDDAYGLAPVVDKGTEDFCCPIGEKGEVGEVGIPAPHPLNEEHMVDQLGKPPTTEEKEAFFKKVMGKLKGWTTPAKTAQLDDSIEEDVVSDLVAGRVYKIKGLNIIARYKMTLETGHIVMSFHGHRFLVVKEDNMVLKAGTNEVEKYLNKIL